MRANFIFFAIGSAQELSDFVKSWTVQAKPDYIIHKTISNQGCIGHTVLYTERHAGYCLGQCMCKLHVTPSRC